MFTEFLTRILEAPVFMFVKIFANYKLQVDELPVVLRYYDVLNSMLCTFLKNALHN